MMGAIVTILRAVHVRKRSENVALDAEQIEPLTDNKTVRLPGAAPGWTSPLQRRWSGAKRGTSGAAASTAPQRR